MYLPKACKVSGLAVPWLADVKCAASTGSCRAAALSAFTRAGLTLFAGADGRLMGGAAAAAAGRLSRG